jgi:MoaA/NifB/PqqE/SkfB family radical SAM enzyme
MLWKALVPPQIDHRVRVLPVAVLNLIATCDSRCVACDYWRSPNGSRLGLQAVRDLLPQLRKLGTKRVLLSGGEPLVHPDLPGVTELLHREGLGVLLHSNGLRLAERLGEIAPHLQHLFLSLDGVSRETYRRMRGVDGLPRVLEGIRQARERFPRLRLGSRTVLMHGNLNELPAIVETGLALGLEPMSFLAADLHSDAFGRNPGDAKPGNWRLPTEEELDELSRSIERLRARLAGNAERVIEGGLASIERIAVRYRRLIRGEALESPGCDAPWHSVVIEPDGSVRPCFFHTAYGRLSDADLLSLLNRPAAVSFRKNLDVAQHSLCRQCVCWKKFGWRERSRAFSP